LTADPNSGGSAGQPSDQDGQRANDEVQAPVAEPTLDAAARTGWLERWGRVALACFIGVALAGVVIAPLALSSGDLVQWARSPQGLGLEDPWPLVVFVALDCAAAVCVGFVVYSAWQGEGAGTFGLLWWLFAGGSALANYRHGETTLAGDDAVFFAAMSLLGPLLLHTTVQRIRRWVRTDAGEYTPRRAHFGLRWLPGVAFCETLAAWQVSIRWGIPSPSEAVARVRELRYLEGLDDAGRVRYAAAACHSEDPHRLRTWLLERGLTLDPAAHEEVLWQTEEATQDAESPTPRRPRQRPARRRPVRATAAAAELANLQEKVEVAYLEREIGAGEVLEGKALAQEIDGHHRRARRVQETLKRLRTAPTEEQRARIAAARETTGRSTGQAPVLTSVASGDG
jgi:hypothetical protein